MMEGLFPWLLNVWKYWQANLEAERFSKATLLVAPDGLGVEKLIKRFSQVLMCSNYLSEFCGFCRSCQLISSGNHPDFHLVSPVAKGKVITVEQIRACSNFAYASSHLSSLRLVVVKPAELMTESAANALLKTLEKSSLSCIFLLVASSRNLLLPTLVSRCQKWSLSLPEDAVIFTWLKEQTRKYIPDCAICLNSNAPLNTLSFIEGDGWKNYLLIEGKLLEVIKHDTGTFLELSTLLSRESDKYLSWLWYLFSDAQKIHFGLSYTIPGALELSTLLSYEQLYLQFCKLTLLKEQLRLHSTLNSELLIIDWLIDLSSDISQ
ncbi:DNA polymerase III subunit delta' [Candidatus Photodesmus blepharus]|uniref:DNA polymerase III subunit delta' n=1 Tax=Candidatus Photodesmus blepharonis TaxID=1179155 RepID=A0A084CN29_9GAMM|nr:DNA polymerase III subunit delta' C-terminal domain-containing protein [Candidatus Photodesmus blepharus]KEY91208.1 DNA polymerase III subunit delta' [Candidatus Photodesmus blepharus]